MILYHGSNMEIKKIDLGKCRPFKDFGRGFYTTLIREQARIMAERTTRIFKIGTPCITKFSFDDNILKDSRFNVKNFFKPDDNWARFIINNRNHNFKDFSNFENNMDCKYDIVTGPVANDDIVALIDVYLSGLLSDEALAKELTYRELSNQISFHTEEAVNCLVKTGADYD